jgi:hypothetical protein
VPEARQGLWIHRACGEFGEPDGIFLGSHCLFCDLQLEIEIAKQKVIACHITHERQRYGLLRVLSSQHLSPGRFGGAAIASEEVHLKDRISGKRENVGLNVLVGLTAAEIRVDRDLRKLIRARDANLRSGSNDALDGKLQIVILLQRRADQVLQLRIVEHLPPWQIGEGRNLGFCLLGFVGRTEGDRSLHKWPMIIWSDCAA